MSEIISIIIPVYNVENYLARCVESVLKQTYQNLEIILVDDGSTDLSGTICDEYEKKDSRIVVIHKPNGGLSSARNAGLDRARGAYVGFIDSDDYVSENMYELLHEQIASDESDIANIMYVRAFESGKLISSCVPHQTNESFSAEKYLEELLMHVGDVSVCTKLFPSELIGELRFLEGVLNEDLLFMIELIKRMGNIRFIGTVGYYYFVREKSISSGYGKSVIDMQKNSLMVLDFVKQNAPQLRKQAYRFALYQNMAYLLAVPKKEATKENPSFCSAVRFVRAYTVKNLFNKYLKLKAKVILCGLMVAPRGMAELKRTMGKVL